MRTPKSSFSEVTAILPLASVDRVLDTALAPDGSAAMVWQARTTLLGEHWWQRFLPPISPAKSILQFIVPSNEAPSLVSTVVEKARLHQQATGAVFSTACDELAVGEDTALWPELPEDTTSVGAHELTENLNVILCTVGHHLSARVSKAAIEAGAHGPVVYYAEGRGLRDRLGWLRITKVHEKEVLMVIAEEDSADRIFDAMAKAGELHLPGRGFMYRMILDRGLFHLASRVSSNVYRANMQQIIHAIDHLNGHTHWRDQGLHGVGNSGLAVGIENVTMRQPTLFGQKRLSVIVPREQAEMVMDILLDAGAPGLSVTYGQMMRNTTDGERDHRERALLHCVTNETVAKSVAAAVPTRAKEAGIMDIVLFEQRIPSVACYIPGKKDYRARSGVPEGA
ncbi:MAG: hypothetical protein AAF578_08075 [Pseudomonadota bacterium]